MTAMPGTTNIYGRVALRAVELLQGGVATSPVEAWRLAADRELPTPSMRDKGCPRSAFLGLCARGRVRGVVRGPWTTSTRNAEYADQRADALLEDPHLAVSSRVLWERSAGKGKAMNGQTDVVIALWQAGVLV
jgi:hypothetical protein